MTTIYFVTSDDHPRLTADDLLAVTAIQQRGHEVKPLVWSASGSLADLQPESVLILRSVWDYHLRWAAFDAWLTQLAEHGLRVFNPLPLVRWNLDKKYLKDLALAGIDVIPTVWANESTAPTLAAIMREPDWSAAVVKPTLSASAYLTTRVAGLEQADAMEDAFSSLRSRMDLMVQPYLEEITTRGEWSLIFLGGLFSHAVIKKPARGDFRVQTEHGGTAVRATPPDHVLRGATTALQALPNDPLYARIDGLDISGRLLLMEAECVDPFLYFGLEADAPQAFATALQRALANHNPKPTRQ